MNENWINNAIFYHIYPLGFCGAPRFAHDEAEIQHRILELRNWIDHFKKMHVNALYLGPIFESYEHGYDTSDYQKLDHRLGTNEDFKQVCDALHDAGIRIVLDGVFHHVGRTFWAFQDLCEHQEQSPYRDWFSHIDFHQTSPYGDPFSYEAWEGHYNLVKLNLQNPDVVAYLLESVKMWMDTFGIDGLRLDAADCIDRDFFRTLHTFTKEKKPDFWLMGEIIHGNYCVWANPDMLDSVTNYECYKGLYSSHNTKNYFEIAYSLNRQFANGGIYQNIPLYNFTDNHDVNRLASVLTNMDDLENVYTLLYTMPGVPSIYYGSEFALTGTKHDGSDADIRPQIQLNELDFNHPLYRHICKLGEIRSQHSALCDGRYEQVMVRNEQLIYRRSNEQETIYALFNLADTPAVLHIDQESCLKDLCKDCIYTGENGIDVTLPPHESAMLIKTDESVYHHEPELACVTNEQVMETPQESETSSQCQNNPSTQVALPALPTIPLGRYRHFKGKEYALLYIAYHSETLEPMVVYRQLYGNGDVWVRPLSMFTETVEREDGPISRFTYIGK